MTRVLLTGASGFIGGYLGPRLEEDGYEVISFVRHISKRDNPVTFGKVLNVDLTDFDAVTCKVADLQPEIIVNLAAQSLVAYSFEHVMEVAGVDYLGAVNLMEAAQKHCRHLKLFLQASTSEVYGYQTEFPTRETAEKKPHCPYSIAKHAVDNYAKYLHLARGFPYFLIRNFNTYGEKDSIRRVTEKAVAGMLTCETVKLGDPDAVRDFLYMDDSIDTYMKIVNECLTGDEMNICTGTGITIRDWVFKIADLMNFKGKIVFNTAYKRPTDIPILIGCNQKARETLGWKPRYTHEEGILETVPKVRDYLKLHPEALSAGGWS